MIGRHITPQFGGLQPPKRGIWERAWVAAAPQGRRLISDKEDVHNGPRPVHNVVSHLTQHIAARVCVVAVAAATSVATARARD